MAQGNSPGKSISVDSQQNRRQYLGGLMTLSVAALAGCSGGGSGDGGDSGGGSDTGIYEGSDFTCPDVQGSSRTQYDAAGTGFLCQFEYPDVLDISESGSPNLRVTGRRMFGGSESYTEDRLLLQVVQSTMGVKKENVTTEGDDVTEIEFGERTAYVGPFIAGSGGSNEAIYTTNIPYEVDSGVRYFGVRFDLSVEIQTKDDNVDAPEDCATAVDETCRALATSVAPNPETSFDEVYEE